MKKAILIFIDGVGIGKNASQENPFFKNEWKIFTDFFTETPHLGNQFMESRGAYFFPVDALMDVEGLPLSGTGQTSIFCGVNAPKIIGKHFGPYPYSTLLPVIKEKNIFSDFKKLGKKVVFANAYPKEFFKYLESGKKILSTTTWCCKYSNVKLKTVTDLRKGKALSAEINNIRWIEKLGYNLPTIKAKTAGKRLLKLADEHDLTVFEYYLTDFMGHGRHPEWFDSVVKTLDEFLFYILNNIDETTNLIICSDHGNFENISIKTHTMNPAIGITKGPDAKKIAKEIKSLPDIKHAILGTYK